MKAASLSRSPTKLRLLELAVDGAAHKLARLIEHTLGKLHDQRTHRTDPPPREPTFSDQS